MPLHQRRRRRGGDAPSHGHRSLDYLWRDNRLPRSLKLRLYTACVWSTLTQGNEALTLTPRALATLNGFNSRQLQRITGRSYRPSDGCAGPYPADACRPPSASCGVGAGPTSWTAIPARHPLDGNALHLEPLSQWLFRVSVIRTSERSDSLSLSQ